MSWDAEASCKAIVAQEPEMATAWDNVDTGVGSVYVPDTLAPIAERICKEVCPIKDICLQKALADEEAEGIRAGFRFHMGKVSSRDAYTLKREHHVKVRVIRRSANGESSSEMQGVREDD